MRSLTIDVGNTRTKVALFVDGVMQGCREYDGCTLPAFDCAIASVTGKRPDWLPQGCLELSASLNLPITVAYATPQTLGPDRVAAASAAWDMFHKPVVVIDAGTCITVDYVDHGGIYRGGAILPGLEMKFRALHNFTARLPLLHISNAVCDAEPIGRDTCGSIVSGVLCATRYALKGYVGELSGKAGCSVEVVVTGGDACHLAGEWIVEPDLVMRGLDKILMMNKQ